MEPWVLQIQIKAHAIMAEIEGMKAENARCACVEDPPEYREDLFNEKAEELKGLASCLDPVCR